MENKKSVRKENKNYRHVSKIKEENENEFAKMAG